MKKLLVFLLCFTGLSIFAQEENAKAFPLDYELTCDSVKIFPETKIIEYLGSVNFQSEIIEIEIADKIVLDQNTQEIIATGLTEFIFDGVIQVISGQENKSVRYKLGERIAYVE